MFVSLLVIAYRVLLIAITLAQRNNRHLDPRGLPFLDLYRLSRGFIRPQEIRIHPRGIFDAFPRKDLIFARRQTLDPEPSRGIRRRELVHVGMVYAARRILWQMHGLGLLDV